MPGIAAGVRADHARFYWHLGDFRANSDFDQDILSAPEYHTEHLAIADYRCIGWDDFIQQQINPFGNVPVYLAIGNHELVSPKRGQSICNNLLTGPTRRRFRAQRLQDDPNNHKVQTSYHWIVGGVDFVSLANASRDPGCPIFAEMELAISIHFRHALITARSPRSHVG